MTVSTDIIRENVDLAPFNTLNVHAHAKYFAEIKSTDALKELLQEPRWINERKYVLGGGSNILFLDDFEGLILKISIMGWEIVKEDESNIWLNIGAGENWHKAVRHCVDQGWGGIENLSLIPGKVGAAPIQNIGAYGVELESVFHSLTAIELSTGNERIFHSEECEFGYRDSIFKQELKGEYAITDVTLQLEKKPELNTSYGAIQRKLDEKRISNPGIKDISDIVIEIRNAKLPDPAKLANAGSFFKNPIVKNQVYRRLERKYPDIPGYKIDDGHMKVPAGWLIEQTGWKGKVHGNVGTYRQQALVIVNHGEATGREIQSLSERIQQAVKKQFNIELVPEVNVVG